MSPSTGPRSLTYFGGLEALLSALLMLPCSTSPAETLVYYKYSIIAVLQYIVYLWVHYANIGSYPCSPDYTEYRP